MSTPWLRQTGLSGVWVLACVVFAQWSNAWAAERVLVLGAVHDDPQAHYATLKPMADYVAERLAPAGVGTVEVIVVRNRAQLLNLMRDGRIDWVSETPFGAVYLAERAGAQFLARRWKDGTPTYRSLFFARREAGIRSLEDLKNHTVAFEHRNSTSAFFAPALMLGAIDAELDALASPRERPKSGAFGYVFSGAEYNTAVWVAKGLVDAGVLSESDWRDRETVPAEFVEDLSIIATSEPMPRAVEVIRNGLDAEIVNALRQTLFDMHVDDRAQPVLAGYQSTARFDELTVADEAVLAKIETALPAFKEQFP